MTLQASKGKSLPFAGSMLSSNLFSLIFDLDTIIMTVLVFLFSLIFIGDIWSGFGVFLILGISYTLYRKYMLTLNAPIATKVVCFSRLLKCLKSLYGKQYGPRSDCSYWSSLFGVHNVCFYT